jgi:alpha-L-rhamnosidase
MISADNDYGGAPLLRKEFALEKAHGDAVRATFRGTALGIYEATINGVPVSEDVLSPGWSSYEWRLRYSSHDVTHLLAAKSVLGASLGNGWYRGRLLWQGKSELYGSELGLLAQLDIEYSDGYVQTIGTDTTWKAGPSATTSNDLYDGQSIDARNSGLSWATYGFDSTSWSSVHQLDFDVDKLVQRVGPPVVRQECLKPARIFTSPAGKTLVDFGQNIVGWLRFTVTGEAGSVVTLRHAEVLENGELATRALRTAKATDTFTLSGRQDFFEPTKTFHGFRYVEVNGWPGDLNEDSLTAVVVHSDLRPLGEFECSDDLVNQLHRNIVWGLKGNFLDLPTDCPQRDERLGWTGDIAVFAPTAAFLFDVKDFLQDWLLDLAAEQSAAGGRVPLIIPDAIKLLGDEAGPLFQSDSTAIWSDAAVWVPWALWEAYGDQTILESHYASMQAHTHHIETLTSPTGLWDEGFQFGDWLDPDAAPHEPWNSKAAAGVVATACLYRTASLTAQAATILGNSLDAEHFNQLADRVKAAFNEHYVSRDGVIQSDCTTVYALSIVFGLLENSHRELAGARLAQLVRENDYRVSTGFAGTPFITTALSDTGYLEDAYRLLLERECPSWLYPVTMGATTVWERWDSMLPDGSVNPGEMTSFNHYALGAIADWIHKIVGGIQPLSPGYGKVLIAPRPGGGIDWASTKLQTERGPISVDWRVLEGRVLDVRASIPPGMQAELDLGLGQRTHLNAGMNHQQVPIRVEPSLLR